MTRSRPLSPAALATLLLAGCAPTVAVQRPATVIQPAAPSFATGGLESVMGQNARSLEARFGRPDLDVREGAARKLQFSGPACVLDAYLYPPGRGGEPVVRYIDARRPDGTDLDRASCVAALNQR
jgi:hypothetical protein